jgi:hypothetical protein
VEGRNRFYATVLANVATTQLPQRTENRPETTMTAQPLDKLYPLLRGEERLPLLLQAMDRGDVADENALVKSAVSLRVIVPDFHTGLTAFKDLALLGFSEIAEAAWTFGDALLRAEQKGLSDEQSERWIRAASGLAFVLRTRWLGWVRFCEERNFPPELYWTVMPGYERVREYLTLAESFAADDAELIATLNSVEVETEPVTAIALTVDSVARSTHELYETRLQAVGP